MTLPGNRKLVPTSGHARIHSDAQEAGLELTDGQLLPVSSADEARLRWNLAANRLEASFSGGPWVKVVSGDASGLVNDTEPGAVNGYGVVPRHALVSDAATPGGIWTPYDDLGIGVVYSVPTLVALGTLPSAALPDGAKVFVYEPGVENLYVLDTVGAHTVTGDTVIAALNGGYWLSRFEGRWDDLQGSLSQGAAVGALTYENYRATAYKMNFFRHDQNDELSFGYQMPHKWKYTTSVNPHLHVVPMADPALAQVAYFNGYYVWTNIDTTEIPDVGGWTMFAVEFNQSGRRLSTAASATRSVRPAAKCTRVVVPAPLHAAQRHRSARYLQRQQGWRHGGGKSWTALSRSPLSSQLDGNPATRSEPLMWTGVENDAQAAIVDVMRGHVGNLAGVPVDELVDEAVRRWMRGQVDRLIAVGVLHNEHGKVRHGSWRPQRG